jgi:hypothetical protein
VSHSIQVSDELWDAYEGSPMDMRDALYAHLKCIEEKNKLFSVAVINEASTRPRIDKGTEIILVYGRRCSNYAVCSTYMEEGTRALLRTNTTGGKEYLCPDCAYDFRKSLEDAA